MFKSFDPNGNGYLSLAEVDKGLRDVLKMDEIFSCKLAIIRAFQATKNSVKSKSKYGKDYIEFGEFKLLLIALRQYFEYWVMFETLDSSGDRRIEFKEFQQGLKFLESCGVKINDPKKEFATIDKNKGGFILFDEFCEWYYLF